MKGVILAAGRGTRLMPLTKDTPKPLLPVAGRPMLDYVLDGFREAGVTDLCMVVGYLADRIIEHYGVESGGFRFTYIRQAQLLGTGDALLHAADFPDGPFLVSFGDILMHRSNHANLRAFFESGDWSASISLNVEDDPYMGAAVTLDGDRVVRIVEKPPKGTSGTPYNNRGVFVFRPEIFDRLRRLTPGPRGEIELTSAIEAMVEDRLRVGGFVVRGPSSDMGTLEAILEYEAHLGGAK